MQVANTPFALAKPGALPKFANIGIGGVAGAGKTHLLGTVGKGNKVLVIDTEGGTVTYNSQTFLDSPTATELENINIKAVYSEDINTAQALVQSVESVFDYLIRTKNKDGYDLVALDSLTEFQERFLSLHKANDPRQSYGALKDAVYSIVKKARSVQAHTIFTARLKQTQDEVLNREIVRFAVSPGTYDVISGLFDSIGFLTIKAQGQRQTRTLDFNHTLRTQGKDRYSLGDLVEPDFLTISSKIAGATK